MPIYEYACTACGERVEARQSFTDAPLEVCEICGGKLRKLYSPVGIVFKGSGFYANDAKKEKKGSAGSATGSSSKGDAAGETKTDSKSESKSGSKSDTKPDGNKTGSTSAKKESPKK